MGNIQRHTCRRQPLRPHQLDKSVEVVFLGTDRSEAAVSDALLGIFDHIAQVLSQLQRRCFLLGYSRYVRRTRSDTEVVRVSG